MSPRRQVTVIGCGPAGLAVADRLMQLDVDVVVLDRAAKPDGMLRHGPTSGPARLRDVAARVDRILQNPSVRFYGSVDVGDQISLADLRASSDAVVIASGGPEQAPLGLAGDDSVGIGTIDHLDGWLRGSQDIEADELEVELDSLVLLGWNDRTARVAARLAGESDDPVCAPAADRLALSGLRQFVVVDRAPEGARPAADSKIKLRSDVTPIGIVGRNRARALRTVRDPDRDGMRRTEDIRAQLLMRPEAAKDEIFDIGLEDGRVPTSDARVVRRGEAIPGFYAAGWVRRHPSQGNHRADADAVLDAVKADLDSLPAPPRGLTDLLCAAGHTGRPLTDWSAAADTEVLLDRFAGEGTLPLADYDELLANVDDD